MLTGMRQHFDIPDDVAYINCAYMSPLMNVVREAAERGGRRKSRPWTLRTEDFFDESDSLREAFARLVGAHSDDIAIVAAASYGISLAATNLPIRAGQSVLVLDGQFPSNVYPWRERTRQCGATVHTVSKPEDGDWTRAVLDSLSPETAVAALGTLHWIDGALIDLEAVAARCRELGAALVVDATQSAGALPIDVRRIQPDFLVSATYKWLMGPYSLGLLYVSERWQSEGRPFEHSWVHRRGAQNFSRLIDYQDDFEPGARRFDVGERSNFTLVPAADLAIRTLLEWGVENVSETARQISAAVMRGLEPLGFEALEPALRAPHYLGLTSKRALPSDLVARLATRQVYVSARGDSVRVTPHVYNTQDDVDRLVAAVGALM